MALTNQQIYSAVMKAADHIERHPELFDFQSTHGPHDCGTPACALGWIGYFSDTLMRSFGRQFMHGVAEKTFDMSEGDFYDRMNELAGHNWINDPALCAKGLRLLAQDYAPKVEQESFVDWFQRHAELEVA